MATKEQAIASGNWDYARDCALGEKTLKITDSSIKPKHVYAYSGEYVGSKSAALLSFVMSKTDKYTVMPYVSGLGDHHYAAFCFCLDRELEVQERRDLGRLLDYNSTLCIIHTIDGVEQ